MIGNIQVNVKKHELNKLIAASYARAKRLYYAHLTFVSVANSKQTNFSTG